MSENCVNPNCPIHGDNEEARKFRETKTLIVTNPELMDVLRVLAVNADILIAEAAGVDIQSEMLTVIHAEMLNGNLDDHPAIRGTIRGFIRLLSSHHPSQEFFAACREIPEEKGILYSAREQYRLSENQQPSGLNLTSFRSFEELMNYLLRRA